MRKLFAIPTLFIFVAACGVKEGMIVEKTHIPDLSYWGVSVSCDGTGRCTTLPHWYSVPECYRLKIRNSENKLKNTCVKFQTYSSLNEGEYWRKG